MNIKKIRDGRREQLEKSLATWEERLKANPSDKKIQAQVELRKKQLEELGDTDRPMTKQEVKEEAKSLAAELPTMKSSKDLYAYCEKEGIPYKVMGKPISTDEIKSRIGEALWNKQHPGEEMPPQIAPVLVTEMTQLGKEEVDKLYKQGEWAYQEKHNGMRLILCIEPDGTCHLTSRDRSVKTMRYSELDHHVLGFENFKSPFSKRCIFDGEIIMPDARITLPSGKTTTSTLQSTVSLMHMNSKDSLEFQKEHGTLRYKCFDVIMLDGNDVSQEPYKKRLEILDVAVKALQGANANSNIDCIETHFDFDSAWDEFEKWVANGAEGIVLKKLSAPYEFGKRSKNWIKLKGRMTVDCFITGSVPASEDKSLKDYIGGFRVSTNYKGKVVEIGAISNIDMETRKDATITGDDGKPALNPKYLNRCLEATCQNFKEGTLRMGSARIENWRPDKNPEDCELTDDMIVYDS